MKCLYLQKITMKKICLAIALVSVISFTAEAQLKTPVASPRQTIVQEFGLSQIELSYSRPAAKGRSIFGDLVPYGKVWRTGANQATTITFGDDVTIGGKLVKAGKYGLLSIPDNYEWTIIITKQLDVTSPNAYKQDEDVVRIKAPVNSLPFPIQSFMILFENITSNSVDLMILWEQSAVSIPITTDVDSKVMAQIEENMKSDKPAYYSAAQYYLDNNKDLNKALPWFDKALEQNPNAFWVHYNKAVALSKLGKKKEAIASAEQSKKLAQNAKNDDYVKLNDKLISSLK